MTQKKATKKETRKAVESIRSTVANRLGLHDASFVAMEGKDNLEVTGSRMDWTGHVRYQAKPLENCTFGLIDGKNDVTINEGSDEVYVDFEATWENGDMDGVLALVVDDESVIRTHSRSRDIDAMLDDFLAKLEGRLSDRTEERSSTDVSPDLS